MIRRTTLAVLAPLTLIAVCSCSPTGTNGNRNADATGRTAEPNASFVAAGDLMSDFVSFQLAVYYLPEPKGDPIAALDKLLEEKFTTLRRVEKVDKAVQGTTVAARIEEDVSKNYAPPDMQSLQYFGRGLSREQAEGLQGSQKALILEFGHSKQHVWEGLKVACELASALARETDGLVWDEETREVFTPESWEEKRLAEWTEKVPNVTRQTTIHAYNTGEYVRAITLGMAKVGLPDIVVEELPWSLNRNIGHTINLVCQSLAEGNAVKANGDFDLDLKSIKNAEVRDPQLSTLKPNAEAVARLTLRAAEPDEGDPNNRIVAITCDRYSGNDLHAKQEAMVSSLFGSEDSIVHIKHDEEILAASQRAKKKLPELRRAFVAGLEPGEFIQLKAPFARPDEGEEWMWVEVTSWKGNTIKGLLKNEPFEIPDLHAGQEVEISQEDVFDFIRRKPDGTEEGNETGKVIEKLQAAENN